MAAVTICSDFGAQENKVSHCFHCFPIYLPWNDGTECHDLCFLNVEFSVQSLNCVWLFATPQAAARQTSLSNTNSQSLPKLMSIESVMPSNHLILCRPLLLLPSIFLSIKAFDCVGHNKLWKILKEMGIPDHLTCLLRNLYAGREATVRTGHGSK